ncbi:MAG: glycosyltransferase [Alphaproteobacteria bacterium]|nr:glycosyltransferase [Alphaproteobacteria bacterium]
MPPGRNPVDVGTASQSMIKRVVFPFRGAEIGGTHVATFALAPALMQEHDLTCDVLCPANTLIASEAQRFGLGVLPSDEAPTGRNNAFSDYAHVQRRLNLLKRERLNGDCVLHCNDINSLRAWGLPARLAGLTVVYHHHALNKLWWPPHLASLPWANGVIAVSDSTLSAIRSFRPDAVKELNPFELDPDYDRQSARRALLDEFGWPDDARVVGWIGNFWARKRPAYFLEAAAALARRDARCRFVMFGRDGDDTIAQIREKVTSLGLDKVAAIPGFRQPAEANLASLDLLLAPAPREPFGRALVEAIVLGVPVVATAGAGHSEIINTWGGGRLTAVDLPASGAASLCLSVLDQADQVSLPRDKRKQLSVQLAPKSHASRMRAIYERAQDRRDQRPAPAFASL